MIDARQMPLFELPPLPEGDQANADPAPVERPQKRAGRRARQLSLEIRLYIVSTTTADYEVQAASPSAAKYAAFKRARAMGQYLYAGGFLAFVAGGCKVAELRK